MSPSKKKPGKNQNELEIFHDAKWISPQTQCMVSWQSPILPAPFLRKVFDYDGNASNAKVFICGLGYYELYINGQKVGDQVLDPVVTVYDKRVRYVILDITKYLVTGKNVIGVILGNGWYNCHTADVWHFDKATWRDYPKLLLSLKTDERILLRSDESWKTSTGPILFDGLRNGETYDARLELNGWLTTDYDDSNWPFAVRKSPPGGILQLQTMPPCKVMQSISPTKEWKLGNGDRIYDLGQNITGWARITVSGKAGTELTIKYGELLDGEKVNQINIARFVKSGDCQTDRYILKGDELETWEPRFTFHGFQYVSVSVNGDAEIKKLEGRVVHTAFKQIGKFSCSNETLNKLQECTVRSYLGNFVGIPSDCPHREKNGWTGDTQLATETGLFNFASAEAYNQWIDSFVDCQRPSGQLPGIVPSSGWGYNWGSGPAWDSAFILIPWYVYLYTGDKSAIETHYDAMKKYVDYCSSMADEHIVSFGLGDWCHVDGKRIVDPALTSTAYYYIDVITLAKFAELSGRSGDQKRYSALAKKIKHTFNKKFYMGDGIYAKGEMTALGTALYQGLAEEGEIQKIVAKLAESVKNNACKIDFGILGAKYVPRVLADNGYPELAYRLLTQEEFPGWGHWIKQGASTLWEDWDGHASRNHIMFGDISAWSFQYLAGITPNPHAPGFKEIIIKPCPVQGLGWVKAEYLSPQGRIVSNWTVRDGNFEIDVEIPDGTTGTLIMPSSKHHKLIPGGSKFTESLLS